MNTARPPSWTLDDLAAQADLSRRTVRYYIQIGLVDHPEGETRAARYTARHLEQLLQIRKWTEAGVSLERIRELLSGEVPPVPPRPRGPGTVEVWSHLVVADGARDHARARTRRAHARAGACVLRRRDEALPPTARFDTRMTMSHESAVLKSITGEAVPLQGVSARGVVNGLLFELEVTQRYRNDSSANIEAVYTFPLPHGAVLLDLVVHLGDKTLTGVVVERGAAEAQYETAIDDGNTAILLERAADGLCTMSLGNLMAGETASIRYRYAQLLRFEQGSVRLTIPTVIAPRYGDAHEAGLQPHHVPQHDVAVAYPFELTVSLAGAIAQGRVTSPSHTISTARREAGVEVALASAAALDRDFILTLDGLAQQSLAVVARDGEGFVTLASFCADAPTGAHDQPLLLKLLVDCSGSMGGDSIAAAKRALHRILASLRPVDRFTLSRFGSSVAHDVAQPMSATASAIHRAAGCVAETDANLGGTEMAGALGAVFALGRQNEPADVLLVTDGEIWRVDELIVQAKRARQRIFVVGIGAAPAESVLRRLAEATGGACEFVAPREDAEAAIVRMFTRLRAPRIRSAAIAWPATPVWTTEPAGGLFGGETVHVWAGFASAPRGQAGLLLVPNDDTPPIEAFLTLPEVIDHPALARMAAASRLDTLPKAEQLALALRYSLLTSRTSFIVVHERALGEKAEGMPALRKVPQMVAAGWGGLGTVAAAPPHPYAAEMCSAPMPLPASFVRTKSPAKVSIDRTSIARLSTVIEALDRMVADAGREGLPTSFTGLVIARVSSDVVDALRALTADGHAEAEIVRAYLEALRPLAIKLGASRDLVRALRKDFTWSPARRALQRKVEVRAT